MSTRIEPFGEPDRLAVPCRYEHVLGPVQGSRVEIKKGTRRDGLGVGFKGTRKRQWVQLTAGGGDCPPSLWQSALGRSTIRRSIKRTGRHPGGGFGAWQRA